MTSIACADVLAGRTWPQAAAGFFIGHDIHPAILVVPVPRAPTSTTTA
jgi:hypothetical protein